MKWKKIGTKRKKRNVCNKCNKEWGTKSDYILVTCPNCGLKVNSERCCVGMVA